MFADNRRVKETTGISGQPNRVGKNTKIGGDITSDEDFRIDGTLEGSIKTSGRIVIGKDGKIQGKVECVNAEIAGKFSGELLVTGLLSLKRTAHIEGDISVAKLGIEPGATFNANCDMKGGALKTISNGKKAAGKSA